ncbi:hypothetical protein Pmani_022647 [Petrolisthes manimaculis]|uniref:FERM domain-containing protein n=1 Tax=Petrolisthes manimaculis TaxID=1843537 RepID=A0AAE1U476_9EUCA|nr:hypothetical protein Pmani_022647 [Petrolisthes manimaculis]
MFLKVRIFPQRPSCLPDSAVQNLVYLQVKEAISSEELICPASLTTKLEVLARQERMEEYLQEAEELDEYGKWHFVMTRPQDATPVRVSVATSGISVTADNRIHEFPFNEIREILPSGKKLTVKQVSKSLPPAVFLGPDSKFVKDVYYLASIHLQFYLVNK